MAPRDCSTKTVTLDEWLTMHRSIIWLISNLMQKIIIYFYIIHLLKSSTCFEHCPPCSSSGSLCRNCIYIYIYAASGIVTLCRWLSCALVKKELFLNWCTGQSWLRKNSFLPGAQDSHLQRVTIPEAAYKQLWRRPPEDEQGNAQNMERILINVLYKNK